MSVLRKQEVWRLTYEIVIVNISTYVEYGWYKTLYTKYYKPPSFGLRQTLMESDNPEAIDYIPYTKLNDKDWLG